MSAVPVLLLAGTLCFFAFEEAVHSVHHLPDHAAATTCVVAASSGHTVAVTAEPVILDRAAPVPVERIVDAPAPLAPLFLTRPRQSRAPPVLLFHA